MELTIEHLAPYLPHDLEIVVHGDGWDITGFDIMMNTVKCVNPVSKPRNFRIKDAKPLLRPLSQLTEEIEHGGERFVPLNELNKNFAWDEVYLVNYANSGLGWHIDFSFANTAIPFQNNYNAIQKLFEWHFDVFELIDNGLAIEKDQG